MGLDYHGYCFLKRAFLDGPFGRVATLGRQNVHLGSNAVHGVPGSGDQLYEIGAFCEQLLAQEFMATSVHSFDASDYEGATFIHDLNSPLRHDQVYDTVLDLGTSEHIFNIPQALKNIISLCAEGGRIIHVLPADNFNGHGFWQISPELFFSMYSRRNGFSDTQVFLAELRDQRYWYEVSPPTRGSRVEFASRSPTYVMAITRKVRSCSDLKVQQSDYLADWEAKTSKTGPGWRPGGARPRGPVANAPAFARHLAEKMFEARCFIADLRYRGCLSRGGPGIRRVPIRQAIHHDPATGGVADAIGRAAMSGGSPARIDAVPMAH